MAGAKKRYLAISPYISGKMLAANPRPRVANSRSNRGSMAKIPIRVKIIPEPRATKEFMEYIFNSVSLSTFNLLLGQSIYK